MKRLCITRLLVAVLVSGCGKDGTPVPTVPPLVTTTVITAITANSATSGGTVTSEGSSAVTHRGVCWNTTHEPTLVGPSTLDGSGSGSFVSSITGLSPATTYYVRAFAVSNSGLSYGNELSFTRHRIWVVTLFDILFFLSSIF